MWRLGFRLTETSFRGLRGFCGLIPVCELDVRAGLKKIPAESGQADDRDDHAPCREKKPSGVKQKRIAHQHEHANFSIGGAGRPGDAGSTPHRRLANSPASSPPQYDTTTVLPGGAGAPYAYAFR